MSETFEPQVAVAGGSGIRYGRRAPFHPPSVFPEYPWDRADVDPENTAYATVRDALLLLGLDRARAGSASWNPLGELVRPGDRVVIKPNAVLDHNQAPDESVFASITHPSVLRAVVDYVVIALGGRGEVVIADAPVISSDFEAWRRVMELDELVRFYGERGVTIRVLDLRETTTRWMLGMMPSVWRDARPRDPLGYTDVDLAERSCLASLDPEQIARVYGADYRTDDTVRAHSGGRHRYRVSNTVLSADVLITVPKLKVHAKVGATLAVKGMVGIIGDKNTIVHHRCGATSVGGDEYPPTVGWLQAKLHDARTWLIRNVAARQTTTCDLAYFTAETTRRAVQELVVRRDTHERLGGGSWFGNDTAWRMGPDLLRVAMYARAQQMTLQLQPRRMFVIVDGVIGGDRNGPLAPRAREAGLVLAGRNAVAVDWVGARLMNIDPAKLKMLATCRAASDLSWRGADRPTILSEDRAVREAWSNRHHLGFELPLGWRGHAEWQP